MRVRLLLADDIIDDIKLIGTDSEGTKSPYA